MRIVVLGAGVIGVASAYWLLRDGHEVALVERREGAGLETSWGNGAIIHVSTVQPWAAPGVPRQILRWIGKEDAPLLLRLGALPHMWRWGLGFVRNCTDARFKANVLFNLELALESARAMAEIRSETGIDYDYAGGTVMKTYATRSAFEVSARAHEALAAHGLVTERLTAAEVVAREPALEPAAERIAGGLFFPQDELGDCHKFSQGLAAWCAAHGAKLHFGSRVERIEVERGRVTGVTTDRGRLAADAVVVALGSYTPSLLRPLGLRVPIYPVKGLSLTAPRRGWDGAPRMAVLDDSRKCALVPIGDRLRVAGSAEITGYDTTPDAGRLAAVLSRVYELFPGFRQVAEGPDAVPWAGLRPVVPSGRPIIGATAMPGLYLNSGHGHTGWTMAAGSGRRLAGAIGRAAAGHQRAAA